MSVHHRYTVDDLLNLPEVEGTRYEVIDGELYVSTQPSLGHQYATGVIGSELYVWSRQSRLGRPFPAPGVIFSPVDGVAPDLIWISYERLRLRDAIDSAGHIHVAPELAVEVLSPGSANVRRDREIKMRLYAQQGVEEYWIVDWRQQTVQVYRRADLALQLEATLRDGDTLTSALLPGFSLAVSDIWEPLDQA